MSDHLGLGKIQPVRENLRNLSNRKKKKISGKVKGWVYLVSLVWETSWCCEFFVRMDACHIVYFCGSSPLSAGLRSVKHSMDGEYQASVCILLAVSYWLSSARVAALDRLSFGETWSVPKNNTKFKSYNVMWVIQWSALMSMVAIEVTLTTLPLEIVKAVKVKRRVTCFG